MKIDEKQLEEANLKYLKFLIGQNLSVKGQKSHSQQREVNNEENMTPREAKAYQSHHFDQKIEVRRIPGLSSHPNDVKAYRQAPDLVSISSYDLIDEY